MKSLFCSLMMLSTVLYAQIPDPTKVTQVSLDELWQYAEQNAPELRKANAELKKADASIAAASPKRTENPSIGFGLGPRQYIGASSFDLEVSFSQVFEINGERALRQKAASLSADVYAAQRDITLWELKVQLKEAFSLSLLAREQVLLAEKLVGFTESTLEISKKRRDAGDISNLAVLLVENDIAQAKKFLRAAQGNYTQSKIMLALLSGWPAATPPEPTGALPAPLKAADLTALVSAAIEGQPLLKANQAALVAAKAQLDAAERDAKPELSLGVNAAQESIGFGTQTVILTSLGVSLPRAQKNQGAIAQATADIQIAQIEGETQRQQLEATIAMKREAVNAAADGISLYQKEILPSLESNLTLLQKAFTLGEIDVLQIGAARERIIQVQRDALLTYAEYFIAVADLESALGSTDWTVPVK